MNKFRVWLKAARLRTLPLSVSGIIMGTALANAQGFQNNMILFLALLTTISFQVTSNFANDYGDGLKGTDDNERIGPERTLQAGLLTKTELKNGIIISALTGLILSILVLSLSFGTNNLAYSIIFLILALLSIWAAIKYTVGKNAYGYFGLGDVFVFLFFGLLAVIGTKFLFTKTVEWITILPAVTIGTLSSAVLNLNNLRDYVQDKQHGKNTLIVKIGFKIGKVYHFILIIVSFLALLGYHLLTKLSINVAFYFLAFVPMLIHLVKIFRINDPSKIDPELKKIALSTFLLSVFFYLAVNYF